jgi:hypothetical protein
MHENAMESLTKRITEVAHDLRVVEGWPPVCTGEKIIDSNRQSQGYYLTDDGGEKLTKVVDELLYRKGWSDKFSEDYIRKRFSKAFDKVASTCSAEPVVKALGALVTEYEGYTKEWTVILPLIGIQMEMDELLFGKVKLVKMVGETADKFEKRHTHLVMQTKHTPEEKQARIKQFAKIEWSEIKDRACAVLTVVAEPHRAAELTIEYARAAIDILRLAILFMQDDHDMQAMIGLHGEVSEGRRTVFSITSDDTSSTTSMSIVFAPLHLTEKTVEWMQDKGILALSDMLRSDQRTKFHDVILRGVHWLANAQAQFEAENTWLNIVTCFETFFSPAEGDPISASIAESVAILTAAGLEARKERKKKVKEFYKLRSKLTHKGVGEVLSSDLSELVRIARDLVGEMIRRKDDFKTQDELRSWIEDQKLGGAAPCP